MKSFNVLTRSNELLLIEEAFSLQALVFQVFWLIYHRLWKHVAIFVSLFLCGILLLNFGIIGTGYLLKMELISSLVIASFAKTWLIQKLQNNNFKLAGIVVAKNLDEAKLKFFQAQ